MALGKRKKILYFMVIFYISIIAVILFGFISGLMETGEQLISFLPIGSSLLEYMVVIFLFYPLSMLIGCLIGQYVMVPLYILIHKKIIGRKMEYGVCIKPKENDYKTKYDFFIPSLIAVSFALLLTNNLTNSLIDLFLVRGNPDEGNTILNVFFISLIITLLIAMFMYSPVWYFLDSKIVYSNQTKVENLRDPIEIRSVGNWYRTFLRGYAGIGLVVAYLEFLLISYSKSSGDIGQQIFSLIFIIPFPIIIAFFGLPVILFLEITKKKE